MLKQLPTRKYSVKYLANFTTNKATTKANRGNYQEKLKIKKTDL